MRSLLVAPSGTILRLDKACDMSTVSLTVSHRDEPVRMAPHFLVQNVGD